MVFLHCGGYFISMSAPDNAYASAMASILSQIQALIEMATYETQTDVAPTLAHWTASIVAGEIPNASLTVFATTDPESGDVVERIMAPTALHLVITLADGSNVEAKTMLMPSPYPYLVSLRPQ